MTVTSCEKVSVCVCTLSESKDVSPDVQQSGRCEYDFAQASTVYLPPIRKIDNYVTCIRLSVNTYISFKCNQIKFDQSNTPIVNDFELQSPSQRIKIVSCVLITINSFHKS